MNGPQAHCSDDCLRRLLADDADPAGDTAVAQHVETCPRCLERLTALAADGPEWAAARDALAQATDPAASDVPAFASSDAFASRWERRPAADTESQVRSMLDPPVHPELPGRIGRYDVERVIGSGGMGVVLKAFDTELNRPVAVKVLAPGLAGNGTARQRFAREARAAAAVVNEHVVAIHNVETSGRLPYLVMPFVAGESLQQRLDREGPLQLCEILRIGRQTAAGLAAAHAQGLVHRDVKPSNILLEHHVDRALLTDFGLARAVDDVTLTHTGLHPGTPQYMSPEQVRGEPVGIASDLFSLGSVLYAMCTGRPPFRADSSYGVLRQIADQDPCPVREKNADIPEWLESIVHWLLARSADDRPSGAAQVAELLERCLAHVQHPTRVPLPQVGRPARRPRRSRTRKALIASTAVALAALLLSLPFLPRDRGNSDSSAAATPPSGDPITAPDSPNGRPAETDTAWPAADTSLRDVDLRLSIMESELQTHWTSETRSGPPPMQRRPPPDP